MEKLRIGLVGTSQLSFPGDKERAFAACAAAMEKHAQSMGFELVVYPQTVIVREDAVAAVAAMEAEKIDFLLVQHTSYSAGQLAPVLAKIRNANVGFWAIPEGEAIEGRCPLIRCAASTCIWGLSPIICGIIRSRSSGSTAIVRTPNLSAVYRSRCVR